MKLFNCHNCGNTLYFENYSCLKCKNGLGFDPSTLTLIALHKTDYASEYKEINGRGRFFRYCANSKHGACNWLISLPNKNSLCIACDLNATIPDLYFPSNVKSWQNIEIAKHRLIYSLLKLKLPVISKSQNFSKGLSFEFKADLFPNQKVTTGHFKGVITLNIKEANEVERIRHQLDLGEKYRTLLGHLRHEIGHYYWDLLIRNSNRLESFRNLFGNETAHYNTSLENYYRGTPPSNWKDKFISIYATAHPWEDWAESFAHYLHMMDTLETAYAFGLAVGVEEVSNSNFKAGLRNDPYEISTFDQIVNTWLPITFALNSLNRSMGYQDFYPFHISTAVINKLSFIHDMCKDLNSSTI
ncbi:MAG: putative zinc-binding metallopeptidase [Opitutaceae bacterium]|nr:putative zinc-binding metallopeptidase [Cytophagales bacterium]